jgi:hypothetical protein
MQVKKVKISDVKTNPKNPRLIKDDKFKKLIKSIQEFPQMLELRPIVVDENNIVLGGNMRLKACIEIGLKEIFIVKAQDLTEEQKDEFIVKDNVGFGEWDWDLLANEWDTEKLDEWGLNIPNFENNEIDYSGKNQEIDVDLYDDQMVIKLKYTEDDYNLVRDQLSKIAATPEQAVYKLLGNE